MSIPCCPVCGGSMKPLFQNDFYCPKDCDRNKPEEKTNFDWDETYVVNGNRVYMKQKDGKFWYMNSKGKVFIVSDYKLPQ